ncbi:pilus assembly protein TadG-related protein [Sphingomonas sp.]|uniref:pilus assembly protein TadG-related protein n=1 Tax=Sphingomonas sp. TaxID=28214 RepID=UPI0025D54789|nr:pilus assembly protein TadG-related protein [Sphingomonas sp.]
MMMRLMRRLAKDRRGAVAPTVALSLIGLLASGGIAFDYARLATMDSELQQAADQAALAGASQLDGQSNAVSRAVAAAQGLLVNQTLLGNDSGGITIQTGTTTGSVFRIYFYTSKANAEADSSPILASAAVDSTAKYIKVAVVGRQAKYALTPIVGAISSGTIGAEAVAGLGSAICKTPPVMICNPNEAGDPTFTVANYIGKGIKLVSVGNGNGTWAPGNFGYLDSSGGSGGAPGLREALGWNTPPGDCIAATGVSTKPGASVSVTDALNTRFDIYDSNVSCTGTGICSASINSVKDLVRPGNANGGNACKLQNSGWQEVAAASQYLPTSATVPLATSVTPKAMGHPRDMCHAVASGTAGACASPIGDGVWDRDAYFRSNYVRSGAATYWTGGTGAGTWRTNTGLSATATRYQVYVWETANRGVAIDGVTVMAPRVASGSGASALTSYGLPQCSAGQGFGSGQIPSATTPDRRRISLAVVNCTANGVNGNSTNVPVQKWLEMFLVEPSLGRARTSAGDVYAEVIRETTSGAGATAGQVIRRDTPYLIK